MVNNIGIALNANIENAIGGSGNDTLIANDNGCLLRRHRQRYADRRHRQRQAGRRRRQGYDDRQWRPRHLRVRAWRQLGRERPARQDHRLRLRNDKIDLSAIDANTNAAGVQVFSASSAPGRFRRRRRRARLFLRRFRTGITTPPGRYQRRQDRRLRDRPHRQYLTQRERSHRGATCHNVWNHN